MSASDELFVAPIEYRKRTRSYYNALGYTAAYRWAHFDTVPFSELSKPLDLSTVAVVTTAAPYKADAGDQGPGAPYNAAAKFYSVYEIDSHCDVDVRISHVAYDRAHTSATDQGSWLPLAQLRLAAEQGVIGAAANSVFGLPTNRSHRTTLEEDCPALVAKVRSQSVDACVLAANCPICHQSVSLAARALEEAGIATVVLGCAKDIVEYAGVPRFLFSDFPLGNAAGKPHDVQSQHDTLSLALRLLSCAPAARTTVQSPQRWSDNGQWKQDYCNIENLSEAEIAGLRLKFDQQKSIARDVRDGS